MGEARVTALMRNSVHRFFIPAQRSFPSVILNEAKNFLLNASWLEILRFAQNDRGE